jgi:hypothetical protein
LLTVAESSHSVCALTIKKWAQPSNLATSAAIAGLLSSNLPEAKQHRSALPAKNPCSDVQHNTKCSHADTCMLTGYIRTPNAQGATASQLTRVQYNVLLEHRRAFKAVSAVQHMKCSWCDYLSLHFTSAKYLQLRALENA